VEDNVLCELAEAIRSPSITADQKQQLLFDLQQVRSPLLLSALTSALKSDDKTLQLNAAIALLQRNDLSGMPIAADLLIHGAPSIPAYLMHNLSSAIGRDVKDPRAVPSLTEILRESKDVYARRAAASALRNTGSPTAILALKDALNDNDSQVRYYAVIGLAEITGSPDWRPLLEDFNSRESYYVQHLKDYSQHK
jgi:HEAT repeat protein